MRFSTPLAASVISALAISATAYASAPTGHAKRWTKPEVVLEMHVPPSLAPDITKGLAKRSMREAMAVWNGVGAGPVMTLGDDEPIPEVALDGHNTVFFVEDGWEWEQGQLALTFTHINSKTGIILEVDMAVNVQHHPIFAEREAEEGFDLQNLFTHELGHGLGLQHLPRDEDATMHPHILLGERHKRDLSADDEEALVELYPEPLTPPGPASCGAGGAGGPMSVPPVLLLLLIPLVARLRRRSRAHAPRGTSSGFVVPGR